MGAPCPCSGHVVARELRATRRALARAVQRAKTRPLNPCMDGPLGVYLADVSWLDDAGLSPDPLLPPGWGWVHGGVHGTGFVDPDVIARVLRRRRNGAYARSR